MENKQFKQLPNGMWEYLVDEKEEMIVLAKTQEEAQRMAQAYFKGDTSVAKKRIARREVDKKRTSLL